MKTLSLVVPVYNTEAYLRRCLDSVLLEEIADELELIAVNDGSTDGSLSILREYQARYQEMFILIDKENGGHGSAVNAGLQAAAGRYFRVLDSDDWFDTPGFLHYLSHLSGCQEDLVVTPYSQEYTWNGTEIRHDYAWLENDRAYTMEEIDWSEGMDYFCLASSTWRTELLRGSGLKLPEKCSYVDMEYNLWPIPLVKSFRFLNTPVYRYFLGRPEQSMDPALMQRQTPMHQTVLCRLIAYYAAQAESLGAGKSRYMRLMIYYMLYTHCHLLCIESGNRRRAYREIRTLDAWIRHTSPEIYALGESIPCLRFSRRLRYRNVLLLDRRASRLLAELRAKLRPGKGAKALP